jgi:hypothetical protein
MVEAAAAHLALDRIASDTERAGGIIPLVTKAPQRKEPFDINEAIREVIALVQDI